jgi:hypothetical protein
MQARDYVRGVLADAREERREFTESATIRDYIREILTTFLCVAIIYRVTARLYVASAIGEDVPEDAVNWRAFAPTVIGGSVRLDAVARIGQSLCFVAAAIGVSNSWEGGPIISAIVLVNVAVLIADPVVLAVDLITDNY